jgi:hypothetical protein
MQYMHLSMQIDMCSCEGRLYRGIYADADRCDIGGCNEPRYKEMMPGYQPVSSSQSGKRTPRKIYRYFPIAHRLRRLFAHPIYSHLFRHGENMVTASTMPDRMEDIYFSERWRKLSSSVYNEDKSIGVCDVRVGFVLSADGASMSKFNSAEFSLTPFILSILNWPVKVRSKVQHLLFTGISPMNNKATAIYLGIKPYCHSSLTATLLSLHDIYTSDDYYSSGAMNHSLINSLSVCLSVRALD